MQYMSLEHLISLPSVLSVDNVPYIPSPNKVDLCFTNQIAPADVNPTAFLLPFMPNGDLVLTDNIRRGPEACGGHIEPGETALEAAIRESMEEAGIARLRWVASAGLFDPAPKLHGQKATGIPIPSRYNNFSLVKSKN